MRLLQRLHNTYFPSVWYDVCMMEGSDTAPWTVANTTLFDVTTRFTGGNFWILAKVTLISSVVGVDHTTREPVIVASL